MNWFSKHAPSIEASAALATAFVAVAALIGVKVQLDVSEYQQKAQSARDSYRGHLALAVASPDFAAPQNGCILIKSDKAGAYVAFVDHLLYSAEQMLVVNEGWEPTFIGQLTPHSDYLCSADAPLGDTPEVSALLGQYRAASCPAEPTCG